MLHRIAESFRQWAPRELYWRESKNPTLMANLLRCFCQGVEVCFEIVLMVDDAGLVKSREKVIAIAGKARGSDTALVLQAASSQHLKRLRVHEMICKPLNPLNIDEVLEVHSSRRLGETAD